MKVIVGGDEIELGTTEAQPTVGIVDYSRRETDDFGVTTVVRRGFARRMSVRAKVPFGEVDTLQRTLADLRAQAVDWIADERFASLSFAGFYKDFSIDLALPPVSFCTLTVEGLAETEAGADPGGDPATEGNSSTLQLVQPVTIDDGVLTAINVPEDEQPVWSADTTYPFGARVIRAHRQWESLAVANVGNEPVAGSAQWMDIGPTNRWAMFDDALGTLTEADGSIIATLDPAPPVNALALLDVTAATVRVHTTDYDRTVSPTAAGSALFLDLPATDEAITVTVTGPGTVSVGTLMIGNLVGLGVTEASPTAGITDYSRKETDDFGDVTVVERAWAKRMDVTALLRTDAIDVVFNRITTVRARPCLWFGADGLEALSIYGFFKDFSIEVGENVSTLSLSIEGLSKAAPLAPLDQTPYLVTVFQNASEAPAPPPIDAGEVPSGWTLAPTELSEGQYRWATQAKFLLGRQQTAWTTPVKVAGVSWSDVADDDPAHPKPEDGATVGATPEQAEAINFHTEQINQALDDIQGLIDTYGTTSSAAASAALAEAAKSAAESAKTASIDARDDASGFATAAAGSAAVAHDAEVAAAASASLAAGYKGEAAASAELAEESAVVASDRAAAASSSATLSATYSTGSRLAATQQLPFDFQQEGTFWFNGFNGLPEAVTPIAANAVFSFPVSAERGKVIRITSNSQQDIGSIGMYRLVAGRRYRVSIEIRRTDGSARDVQIYRIGVKGDGTTAGNGGGTITLATVNQWYSYSVEVDAATLIGAGASSVRCMARVLAGSATVDISTLKLEDITDGYSLQGQVSTVAAAVATTTDAVASLTTEVRAAGSNMLPNGGLENGFNSGIANAGSFQYIYSTRWGPYAGLLNVANGTYSFQFANISVPVGGTYTLSCDPINVNNSGGQVYVDATGYDAGGTLVWDSGQTVLTAQFDFDTTVGRRKQIATTFTIPAGVATIRCRFVCTVGAANNTVGFRQMKLEYGSVATPYTPEASVRTISAAATDAYNRTRAYWQVNAAVPGSRAQLSVWADNAGAGVDIVGDVAISGSLLVNGTINGVKLQDLAVQTAKLANNAATALVFSFTAAAYSVSANNTWEEVKQVSIAVATNQPIQIIMCGDVVTSWSGSLPGPSMRWRILRNGVVIRDSPLPNTSQGTSSLVIFDTPLPGNHTYSYQLYKTGGSLSVENRYLAATELKK